MLLTSHVRSCVVGFRSMHRVLMTSGRPSSELKQENGASGDGPPAAVLTADGSLEEGSFDLFRFPCVLLAAGLLARLRVLRSPGLLAAFFEERSETQVRDGLSTITPPSELL